MLFFCNLFIRDEILHKMNDKKGTSLVIVNSKKGQELLNYINENIYIAKVDFEEAIFHNKRM